MSEILRESEAEALLQVVGGAQLPGLNIAAVSGPGGIGKSYLVEHVLGRVENEFSDLVVLRVDGSKKESIFDFLALVEGQLCPRSLPPPADQKSDYFPTVRKIAEIHRALVASVKEELSEHKLPREQNLAITLLRFGKILNRTVPKSRGYLNLSGLQEADVATAWEALTGLSALKESTRLPGPVRDLLGITRTNRVKRDLYGVVADALLSDLSAILAGWQTQDAGKLTHGTVKGLRRLLLVIDDYEALGPTLGDFLVGSLVPKLTRANFPSVLLVIGRDDLELTDPGWAQHHKRQIHLQVRLRPFDRATAFSMLSEAHVEAERAEAIFKATDGFPFLLRLALDEIESGGGSALFLRKFYDRTTRWMSDEQRSWFDKVCYLDPVNEDTLRRLFASGEVQRVQDWFEQEASIRDPMAAEFRVRGLIREKVLRYREVRAPQEHRSMLERAANELTTDPQAME